MNTNSAQLTVRRPFAIRLLAVSPGAQHRQAPLRRSAGTGRTAMRSPGASSLIEAGGEPRALLPRLG